MKYKPHGPLTTIFWIVALAAMFIGWGMALILLMAQFDAFGL